MHRGAAEFKTMGIDVGKYGMGWFAGEIDRTKLVWHSGTLPHFFAYMALLPEQKTGFVLLFNADHHWMNPVLTEVGAGVAALLAGEQLAPIAFVRLIPWMLRGLLLIPLLQIAGVVTALWQLRRWRRHPERRPDGGRTWGQRLLLPFIWNLPVALMLKPMLSKRRGYLRLYMPDISWIALVCGGFALVWSFLRAGLVIRALRRKPDYE
jgi:hypothetical protein